MKNIPFYLFLVTLFLISGCKKSETPVTPDGSTAGEITISGKVLDFSSGAGIDNVAIIIQGITGDTTVLKSTATTSTGTYSLKFSITKPGDLKILAQKEGYLADSTVVFATAGREITASDLLIKQSGTASGAKRSPAAVYLKEISLPVIGVRGSGSPENTEITFVVVDSVGRPLDLLNSVTVNFSFGSNPLGGLKLDPASGKTDAAGEVKTVLTSGTIAGAIQLTARIGTGASAVTSIPVAVTIHGGLPDQDHFSIAPELFNIPGWHIFGVEDKVTAYVGDKYSNPVRPSTPVYFNTTGGIIPGSALTSDNGLATVALYSALPRPVHPTLGNGFATVTGFTADENQQQVSRSIVLLFSGPPIASLTPTTFDIPNLGSQTFNYVVQDINGNPLVKDTKITIKAEGENIKLLGDVEITLPDTQSQAWTQFSFVLLDTEEEPKSRLVSLTLEVDGANGKVNFTIYGTIR